MRITKWVDFGSGEIAVDLDFNDVSAALSEAFDAVIDSKRGDDGPDRRDVARTLNSIGTFFNGLKDEHIALLSAALRSTVEQFLQRNANRFAVGGLFVPPLGSVAPRKGPAQPPDGGGASNI